MIIIIGLKEVEQECQKLDINFHLLSGTADECLPKFVEEFGIGAVVTDFSPLRIPRKWVESVKKALPSHIPFCQVILLPTFLLKLKLIHLSRLMHTT